MITKNKIGITHLLSYDTIKNKENTEPINLTQSLLRQDTKSTKN